MGANAAAPTRAPTEVLHPRHPKMVEGYHLVLLDHVYAYSGDQESNSERLYIYALRPCRLAKETFANPLTTCVARDIV